MKKRFDRYFGNNIGRKLYIASLALIAVGVIIGYFYFWGYGMPLAALGVIGFILFPFGVLLFLCFSVD